MEAVTLIEIDLLQQCFERLLEQIQFCGYLSKFFVFASTGHVNWLLYQEQLETDLTLTKSLRIINVTSSDIDKLWFGIVQTILVQGPHFYLTKDAPLILTTLQKLGLITRDQPSFDSCAYC
jgi:hypothetical protein